MDATERLALLADLANDFCELNHGPNTTRLDYPAIDYLVIPFGYSENDIEQVSAREMVIPVCAECALALQGEEWTLLYCFECNSSRWVLRSAAKNKYRHHALWLRGCPDCSGEFGGLYFNDQPTMADFLSEVAA